MFLLRLALSNLLVRKTRTLLAVAAIALSVSLVVAVTSGHATIEAAAQRILGNYLGSVDAKISRQHETRGGVPESLLLELRRDPDVADANARIRISGSLLDRQGKPIEVRAAEFIGLDRPGDRRVDAMEMEAGEWFESAEGNVAVLDQVAAMMVHDPANLWADEKRGSVKVGETIQLPGTDGNLELKVVGIVRKPKVLAILQPSVYVPLRTLRKWAAPETPDRVSSISIDLAPAADPKAFAERWRPKLAAIDPTLLLKLTSDRRGELDQNLRGLQVASYLASMVSLLAAAFIIASALSMGVHERQRTLAMMRAIGAEKRQLAGLVIVEGLLLSAAGAAVGVGLGIFWTLLLRATFADLLMAGVTISGSGIALAVIGALVAALAASILPALGASRTDPLEAMTPLARPSSLRTAMLCAIPGALLVAIDGIALFSNWRPIARLLGSDDPDQLARSISFYGHFSLGIPCLLVGFFLLAPLFVILVERALGPVVAAALRVRFPLLRQQLSGGVWRSATTAAGLMLGLAILVVLQVQGNTVIGGWRIPDKFPDMFVTTYKLGGLTRADMEKIRSVPNVKPDEILPITIASPEFGTKIFSLKGAAILSDATMFFGVDPKLALNMMELDFRDGTKEQAIAMMTANRRHVLVTEEFYKLKGLKTGDKLILKTPKNGEQEYTIAGVVWSPGLDVVVSLFDLSAQFEQRTAASLFGTLEDARDDFGVEGIYLFAINLQGDVQKEVLAENMQKTLGSWGLLAGDVRALKYLVQYHFRKLLMMISSIAFAAMAVAALGVANTIMASVRSRRWQFGIMRSIGVTRGQLLRLVLAEAILLGFVGVALGLTAGAVMSINAKQLLLVLVGYDPAFTIPWNTILMGIGIVLGIALLAGLWPAASTARTDPLELLAGGRAAV